MERQDNLLLCGTEPESIVDGPGFRFVVFVQGCPHHCRGCHNPDSHSFSGGYERDIQSIVDEIKENPLLSGVTFSGGEPFCQAEGLYKLAQKIKELNKSIYTFSGYTYEQLREMSKENPYIGNLLDICDVLIDGKFVEKLRDLSLLYRGSSNQRIIDLKKTKETGKPVIINDEAFL